MAVCRFWQQGSCRFGSSCRFEHPADNRAPPPSNGNRFAPLQNNPNPRNNNSFNPGATPPALPYGLDKAAILADLTTEAPQWILSAYGPGRAAPAQLFGGAREQSFEEMRILHYIAMAAGNPQQAAQEAEKLFHSAQQQMQAAANNVDAAIEFVINGEREHPNRVDIVNQTAAAASGGPPNPFSKNVSPFPTAPVVNPFGAPTQSAVPTPGSGPAGAFGQPSSLGIKPSPFGAPAPAFGAPTKLGGGTPFGQPSALGGGGAFGQPSSLGNAAPFGQSSALGGAAPFGQPSSLGQKPSPFGAPSNAPAATPFSSFSNNPTPFSQPPATSAFGNPSLQQSAPFAKASDPPSNPFGVRPTQSPSPFNNPTPQPFGVPPAPATNPFGVQSQPQAPVNPFGGGQSVPPSNLFGQPSASAPSTNPFGAPQQEAPAPSPFSNAQPSTIAASNPFGQPQPPTTNTLPNPFAPSSQPPQPNGNSNDRKGGGRELGTAHPNIDTYSTRDRTGKIISFNGKQVVYKEDKPGFKRPDGKWEKIMFPNGPPAPNRDAALAPEKYAGNDALRSEYQYVARHGVFKDGKMPLIPPLQEWCSFDF